MGWLLNKSSEVPCPDQYFYQELQALALIHFMAIIPVIVTSQCSVTLVRTYPHGRRPFELMVIPDEGEQPVVRDVKRGELGRIPFSFGLLLGALFALALASFLFGLAFCHSFTTLGSYNYCLQCSPDIILQSEVFVCPLVQLFHGCRWIKGKGLEERSSRPKAPSKFL